MTAYSYTHTRSGQVKVIMALNEEVAKLKLKDEVIEYSAWVPTNSLDNETTDTLLTEGKEE